MLKSGTWKNALVILSLFLAVLACQPPPTSAPTPPTSVPPTVTPTEAVTVTPTATPTATPVAAWLPAGSIALYGAGSWETPGLYALLDDGSSVSLDWEIHGRAAASRTGRWIASSAGPLPAGSLVISNLEDGTTYTLSTSSGFDLYGMAFDRAETRLAFLELGSPESGGTDWAIVVVDLGDGSTTRFEATTGPGGDMLPGNPTGWTASGDELLINTFVPFSEAGSAGLWGISLPPGAAAAPIRSLSHRELLTGDGYLFEPWLSPGGERLLYVNRDYDYVPDGYEPVAYDLAVNQLGVLDLPGGAPSLIVDVTDGGALGGEAAWSPDGSQILFAEGDYAGDTFASLVLKIRDQAGTIRDVGPAPLPSAGGLNGLRWCAAGQALSLVTTGEGLHELHTVNLTSGDTGLVVSDTFVSVLGCISE